MTDTIPAPTETPVSVPAIPQQTSLSTWESIAALLGSALGKFINDETALGKAGKVTKWTALSLLLVALFTAVVAHPAVFVAIQWGTLVSIANIALVFISNILNPNVPNF